MLQEQAGAAAGQDQYPQGVVRFSGYGLLRRVRESRSVLPALDAPKPSVPCRCEVSLTLHCWGNQACRVLRERRCSDQWSRACWRLRADLSVFGFLSLLRAARFTSSIALIPPEIDYRACQLIGGRLHQYVLLGNSQLDGSGAAPVPALAPSSRLAEEDRADRWRYCCYWPCMKISAVLQPRAAQELADALPPADVEPRLRGRRR